MRRRKYWPKRKLTLRASRVTDGDVLQLMGAIRCTWDAVCGGTIDGRRPWKNRVYWWNNEIADLRRNCLKKRRILTRTRTQNQNEERRTEAHRAYGEARKALRLEIGRAKNKKWRELLEEVENDVWGQGYAIVTKRLFGGQQQTLTMEKEADILQKLFPRRARVNWEYELPAMDEFIPFTTEEVMEEVKQMKNKKVPGPDGIPSETLKLVIRDDPTKNDRDV